MKLNCLESVFLLKQNVSVVLFTVLMCSALGLLFAFGDPNDSLESPSKPNFWVVPTNQHIVLESHSVN